MVVTKARLSRREGMTMPRRTTVFLKIDMSDCVTILIVDRVLIGFARIGVDMRVGRVGGSPFYPGLLLALKMIG